MPASDYASVGSGALKLKGAPGVDKKKKKKKLKAQDTSAESSKRDSQVSSTDALRSPSDGEPAKDGVKHASTPENEAEKQLADFKAHGGKTESEIKFDEQRRRRLNDRLKREGVKTHKERVEDLNRYLSTLSEHHDMPRIGPG